MYDPEDLKNMRDEMGIDDKMVEEYRKKQEQAGSEQQDPPKQQEKPAGSFEQKTNLGFFDTVKAAGKSVLGKVRNMAGYDDKTEL